MQQQPEPTDLTQLEKEESIRRKEILAQMTRDAEEMGLYELTAGPPPPMR